MHSVIHLGIFFCDSGLPDDDDEWRRRKKNESNTLLIQVNRLYSPIIILSFKHIQID